MFTEILSEPRARLTVHQERLTFNEKTGLWEYKQVGEDAEACNILTDAGRVTIHTFIYGTATQRTAASLGSGLHWVGLTNDGTAPAAGDTALTGELSGNGLDRIEADTVTLPTGSGTTTQIQHVFTYTGGGTQDVQKTALFDASSGGNMAHEILFTQKTLSTSDTITLTFNITAT